MKHLPVQTGTIFRTQVLAG